MQNELVKKTIKMENTLICRACLVTNVKLYNMQSFSILAAYSDLTGISVSEVGVYIHICYECAARLKKCEDFRSLCFKAHETLTHVVTKEDVQRERKLKCLESPLKQSNINICDYNDCKLSNDQYSLNAAEIKIETTNDHSDTEHILKCELIEYEKQENNAEHNISISCEFEDKNNSKVEGKHDLKDNSVEMKKKKVVKRKVRKVCTDIKDDEPLSKLSKKENKKAVKSKIKPSIMSRFDAQFFEAYATVTTMTTEDAKKEVELRKESKNYKNCPYKCNLCYRGYGAQIAYNNHMKKHSLSSGIHECEFCYLRFPKSRLYNDHLLICHKRKFCCKLCPYICFSLGQARSHVKLHKGVKYTCDLCQETFSMPNTLLSHKRIKHPTEVVCALCGSTFANSKGLNSHYLLVHKQETNDKKGPQCIECDIHFATETAWKRHLVLSAKHDVSNGCEICGDTYPNAEELKSHVKSHAVYQTRAETSPIPPLPAACSLCDKWLTIRDEYKEHMTTQHPDCDITKKILARENRPCVCEFCGKSYKKRGALVCHQRKHTGERPYTCDVCQKSFPFSGTLNIHKKIHDSKRMFKCDSCDKIFKCKIAQTRHVKKTHLNIRPHSCDVCGKSYHNPCEVKYHKQHVHGNVPWPKRDRSKRNKTND